MRKLWAISKSHRSGNALSFNSPTTRIQSSKQVLRTQLHSHRLPVNHGKYKDTLTRRCAPSNDAASSLAEEEPPTVTTAANDANSSNSLSTKDETSTKKREEHEETKEELIRKILLFSAPVISLPLLDPLMSLIDTVCLSQMASNLDVAGVAPASVILNFIFYTFTAVSIATVTLVAERLRQNDDNGRSAAHALASALALAVISGSIITVILLGFGPRLLAATGCDALLLPGAGKYLAIRAIAAPAAFVTSVSQAGHLGQMDSITPFRIVLASLFISLLGDLVLIGGFHMGLSGAAWTTVAAQYFSAVLLVKALGKSRVRPKLELPDTKEVVALMKTAAALGVYYLCKTMSYLMMQGVAARLPAMTLAAHVPVWQLYNLMAFLTTPLEQAALAFVPAAKSLKQHKDIITILYSMATAIASFGICVSVGVPAFIPGLLSPDVTLWPMMQSVWKQMTIALICCGLDVSSTGILLAEKQHAYVARSMGIALATLAGYLYWCNSRMPEAHMATVWTALAVFFGIRAMQTVPRVWKKIIDESRQTSLGGAANAEVFV